MLFFLARQFCLLRDLAFDANNDEINEDIENDADYEAAYKLSAGYTAPFSLL